MRRIKKAFVASLIFLLLFCGYTVHAGSMTTVLSSISTIVSSIEKSQAGLIADCPKEIILLCTTYTSLQRITYGSWGARSMILAAGQRQL